MEDYTKIIDRLFKEWVHSKYLLNELDTLFSLDQELNQIRENYLLDFYLNISDLFWNYFLTNIAKLLDPSSQGSFNNLSLFILVDILKNNNELGKSNQLETRIKKLKEENNNIILYRRKNLAHLDLDYSIGEKEFSSSTDITQLYSFYNEVINIINFTLKALNLEEKSDLMTFEGKHKGAHHLNNILIEYVKLKNKDN